jgi:hypothetical protein
VKRWLRAFRVLLGMELRQLARTRAVYAYMVLPVLLGPPLVVAAVVLLSTVMASRPVVGLPLSLAEVPGLVDALEAEDLEVALVDDADAAWAEGGLDAAIVGWQEGDGLMHARSVEGHSRWRWQVRLQAVDDEVASAVEDAIDEVAEELVKDWVAAAGADPGEVVDIARVVSLERDDGPGFDLPAGVVAAYGALLLSIIGYFVQAVSGVSERVTGVTETVMTAPVPASALLAARLAATGGLQLVLVAALAMDVIAMLGPIASNLGAPQAGWLAGVAAGATLISSWFLVAGSLAPSVKDAMNAAGMILLGTVALMVVGHVADAPAWVPVAGLAACASEEAAWVSALCSVVGTVVTVAALAWLVERDARFKVGTG